MNGFPNLGEEKALKLYEEFRAKGMSNDDAWIEVWSIECNLDEETDMDEIMKDWHEYLDVDFGNVDGSYFHIDGYVYLTDDETDTPYRSVQFCGCYVPLDYRDNAFFVGAAEEGCNQYMKILTEEEAKETIEWYLEHCEVL